MSTIADNLRRIRERIAEACARSGRSADEIDLVAVTKTVPANRVEEAIRAGVRIVGENRVQEAQAKKPLVREKVSWHMVGHLQTNKVRKALQLFDLIQSLDSLHLAEAIQKQCEKLDRYIDVLVEVNTSGEASKYGVAPEDVFPFVESVAAFPRIRVRGLMTIAPLTEDSTKIRSSFVTLRSLFEELRHASMPNVTMEHLSMGMTDDFELAIEEGSTMVRLGRAIFGERNA